MRRIHLWLFCMLMMALVNCNRDNGTEQFPAGVLYQDNFAVDTGNWLLESDLDASARHAEEQLHVAVNAPNLIAWAELQNRQFSDFVLEVDATQVAGPDNNSYGIIFRMKNPSAYYLFDISGDGYYALKRRDEADGGQWVWLIEDWMQSPAIHQGASTNRIKLVAQGSTLTFYVNDQQVNQVEDGTYRSGLIGLDAGSFEEPGVQIAFDNLVISKP